MQVTTRDKLRNDIFSQLHDSESWYFAIISDQWREEALAVVFWQTRRVLVDCIFQCVFCVVTRDESEISV